MTDAYYGASFHLPSVNARTPLGNFTVDMAGEDPINVNLAGLTSIDSNGSQSGWFWHWFTTANFWIYDPRADVLRYPQIALRPFGYALQVALNAAATSGGWPSADFEVVFSDTQYPVYSISYGSNFTYTFSTAAGQRLLGGIYGPSAHGIGGTSPALGTHTMSCMSFVTGMRAGSQSWGVPFVCVTDELDGHDYEPEGVASEVAADDGTGYGNARTVSRIHRDWQQQFCSYELVHGPQVMLAPDLSFTPYPFNDMIQHCRSIFPFYVAHGGFHDTHPSNEVFVLRQPGNFFRPRSASRANFAQNHVDFRTRVVGHLTTGE
jgi:hypothetical protein